LGGVASGGGDVVTIELGGLGVGGAELAEDDELGESAGVGTFTAGFRALDESEFALDARVVDAEAVIVVAVGIFAVVLGTVIEEGPVVDGRGDDLGPVQAPIGGDHALDDVEFGDGAGLEGIEVILLVLFEQGIAFPAENDHPGGKAMFHGVQAGTLPAFLGSRTVR